MHRSDASANATIRARPRIVNPVWHGLAVRWVRRGLVVLLLAAPVLIVTAVAWPSDGDGNDGRDSDDVREEGSGPDGALVAGDTVEGRVGFGEVAEYRLVGDESRVRIDVAGVPPMDATLTVRDGDGDELAYNDDTNGLDPQVTVELDGEELTVEVRELGNNAGSYTLSVE
jgi:hypothetical protein